jgi:hypothetical protein
MAVSRMLRRRDPLCVRRREPYSPKPIEKRNNQKLCRVEGQRIERHVYLNSLETPEYLYIPIANSPDKSHNVAWHGALRTRY